MARGPVGPLTAASSAKIRLIAVGPLRATSTVDRLGRRHAVDVVVERCAGLDVHRDNVVATVRFPSEDRRRWLHKTRTFKATLAGLSELADWLGSRSRWSGWRPPACTGSPSFRRWRTGSSAGCSTLSTFATFPGARP